MQTITESKKNGKTEAKRNAKAKATPKAKTRSKPSTVAKPVEVVRGLCESMKGKPRKEVIAAAVAKGVNRWTASTQYQLWKNPKSKAKK